MGTLLDFASAPRPVARMRRSASRPYHCETPSRGELVLFPGVRYERNDLDLAPRIGTIGTEAETAHADRD
ncbi:hypothetical protein GCM10011316_23570 [Roseibium aquae]|uniref:Uncharacterized protein n=1 Tax=Roseibium aquae TaxID=1323746 RepID=A0A916TK21_9HYPH|nr:hypothetical protein GCM10011316_23570 [Roseibium aquae]